MSRRSYSLRWRIVSLVSIPIVPSGLAIGALALYTSWHEIQEVYDAQLIHVAKVLRQLALHELQEDEGGDIELIPETEDLGYKYEQNIAFRIWRDGAPVTRSGNALPFDGMRAPPGLSSQKVDGKRWRFFVYLDPASQVTVETSERYEIRYELIGYLLLSLLLPASLFVPVVLVLVWYGTGRGLRPLAVLSKDVDSRDSDDLRSIESERIPREIDSLIKALNRLFCRLQETLDREREFTDNAAHELRTPLAAIKTQAQALRRHLKDIPECRAGLSNLQASIDRATKLVDKLLSFSRLQKHRAELTPVALAPVVNEAVAEIAPDAVARQQELALNARGTFMVRGDEHALGIMTRNLVENAVKYTPRGGIISVELKNTDDGVRLEVIDDGPGIAESDRERVFNRFYRGAGAAGTGSGLGLTIVKWIVDQHHAELRLSGVEPHGLRCTVIFPNTL